ncbi:MAG: hypothetical protein Q4F39_02290 [Bacteroidia bacterium]|nr:hypothetical protein [Bacteroidia bacterium]
MKNLEDIENISFEELERIASDGSIRVPEGLQATVKAAVEAAAAAEDTKRKAQRRFAWIPYASAFAAVAVCAAIVFIAPVRNTPKDTFEDPAAAYAELEKTFNYIAQKMDKGIQIAETVSQEPLEIMSNTINKTY